jgi:hypothetical protein
MLDFTNQSDVKEMLERLLPSYNGRLGWRANQGVPKNPRPGYVWGLVGYTPVLHKNERDPKRRVKISPVLTLTEDRRNKRYSGAKLRELRAERGVSKNKRFSPNP